VATYEEIFDLRNPESGFGNRVLVGLLDVANDVAGESDQTPNHDNRIAWAAQVLRNPDDRLPGVLNGVLIANQAASVQQILNAEDSAIKSAIAALVDLFAGIA
jgi:hypothetical protein